MKKILFVNFSKDWGGGEKWYETISNKLDERGYQIVFIGRNGSKLHKKVSKLFFTMSVGGISFLNPIKLLKSVKLIKSIDPDVVVLNSSKELKNLAYASKIAGVKKIIYRRGILNKIKPGIVNKFMLRKCVTDYLANSKVTTQAFSEIISPDIVNVIYNGIECSDNVPVPKYDSNKLAIVARLSHEKGVDIGIRSFNEALKTNSKAELHIFGTGKEEEALKDLVNDLNISGRVIFRGFSENVNDDLKDFSLLMMPSRKEGFGFVLLEAMNNYLPCVAFKGNSAEEIIVEGESGYLVDSFDINSMGEKINKILTNPDLARKFGKYGNDRLKEYFTLDRSVDELVKLIER